MKVKGTLGEDRTKITAKRFNYNLCILFDIIFERSVQVISDGGIFFMRKVHDTYIE